MTDFLVKRFIKNSTDVNDPAVRTAYGNLAGAVGIFCNVLLCAAKLAVGTLFGVVLLAGAKRLNKFYELTNETLKTVGPILFVTAAGGVLGKVIATSDMVNFITAHATVLGTTAWALRWSTPVPSGLPSMCAATARSTSRPSGAATRTATSSASAR